MNDTVAGPPRRARHLIDPTAPRPARDLCRERESLTRVDELATRRHDDDAGAWHHHDPAPADRGQHADLGGAERHARRHQTRAFRRLRTLGPHEPAGRHRI